MTQQPPRRSMRPGTPNTAGRIALAAALAAATLASAPAAWAQKDRTAPLDKRVRQIQVMEGIIDQVLIDSPNFLVRGRDNARGLYIEEFGAVFTFDASLIPKSWRWDSPMEFNFLESGAFEVREDGEGNPYVIFRPEGSESDSEGENRTKSDDETGNEKDNQNENETRGERDRREVERAVREAEHKKQVENARKIADRARVMVERLEANRTGQEVSQEALYRGGKDEIIQTLLDYGATITTLRDDQWVAIAAFLRDSDFFVDNKLSRLVVKARVSDLRAHAGGRLSDPDIRARIVEEEY